METSQRLADVLLAAFAKALPDRIPAASKGTMNNLTIGATHPDPTKSFAYYETIGGGTGAGPEGKGTSGLHSHMTNTMNTPIEALEASCLLMVERFELRRDSGGLGRHHGGDGISRDIRLLQSSTVTIISDRRTHPPNGLSGRQPGKTGENWMIRADGTKAQIPSKVSFRAEPGDIVSIRTPAVEAGAPKSDRRSGFHLMLIFLPGPFMKSVFLDLVEFL